MTGPNRAPVRPRVISPETGDTLPLEDLLPDLPPDCRAVEIVGDHGWGKSTALAHLEAVLPADRGFVFLDDAPTTSIAEAAQGAVAIFTSVRPRRLPGAASYRLVPWGCDELVEYLMAVHPAQCHSVLARLQASEGRRPPEGPAELWQIVLDRMAEDETVATVADALREEVESGLPGTKARLAAEIYCLEDVTGNLRQFERVFEISRLPGASERVIRLLRYDRVRFMLASGLLAWSLEKEIGRKWLEQKLPYALVKMTGRGVSPTAIDNLTRWLRSGRVVCHPMAASILHAAGRNWTPRGSFLAHLRGAYLDGARWPKVDLEGARLERTDLSHSDLTGAVLNGALAHRARFVSATLSGASLVNIQARGADFSLAVLQSADARSALFRDANFEGADLSQACLAAADLQGACLTAAVCVEANLTYAVLTKASIEGADFTSADLRSAMLDRLPLYKANFSGADFSHADLCACNLECMELPAADFLGARLRRALLTGSRMQGANFAGADLTEARLADVDWEDADLHDANLRRCTFHLGSSRSGLVDSPIASEGTRTGFYGDDFDSQTYRAPEEIRKANLRGVDLRGADIEDTDFYLVDLRGVKCTPDQFEHLRRSGAILVDRQ